MIERFSKLPRALKEQVRFVTLGDGIPALVAHPDWETSAPVVIWLHGRTVRKELDPGRYLRWIRNGIGVCALDLPGHGERYQRGMDSPEKTLFVVQQAIEEIDVVVEALQGASFNAAFDARRMALGGMSAGGMVALRRCCDDHPFVCASVESTAGDFSFMDYSDRYKRDLIDALDPSRHVDGWRTIPLLALHSEKDHWVNVEAIRSFVATLEARARKEGSDPGQIVLHTWEQTGAPYEHAGFGRFANDAKNMQLVFFRKYLLQDDL